MRSLEGQPWQVDRVQVRQDVHVGGAERAGDGPRAAGPTGYLNRSRAEGAIGVPVELERKSAIGRERTRVTARKASPDERARLWPEFTSGYPGYAKYATKTAREIPVVLLEPRAG